MTGLGEQSGDHDSDRQAQEVVADRDEIGRIAMISPSRQNRAQQRQQKAGKQKAGQRLSAPAGIPAGRTPCWKGSGAHRIRLYRGQVDAPTGDATNLENR